MPTLDELLKQTEQKPQSLDDLLASTEAPLEIPQDQIAFPESTPELESLAETAISQVQGEAETAQERQARGELANLRSIEAQEQTRKIETGIKEGIPITLSIAGGVLGGPAGAGILGAQGQALVELMFPQEGLSPLEQLSQQKQKILKRGVTEAAFDKAAGIVTSGLGKILRPFADKTTPLFTAVKEQFKRVGGKFTPATASSSKIAKFLEDISRAGFFSKEVMDEFFQKADASAFKLAESLADDIAEGVSRLDPEDAGELFRSLADGKLTAFKETFDTAFTQLDELTKPREIPTLQVVEKATEKILSETGEPFTTKTLQTVTEELGGAKVSTVKLKGFLKKQVARDDAAGRGFLKPELRAKFDKWLQFSNKKTFQTMGDIRSTLLSEIRDATAKQEGTNLGLKKKVASLVLKAMKDPTTLEGATEGTKRFHKNLMTAYAQGSQAFDDKLMKGLLKKGGGLEQNPEILTNKVFKRNASKQIRKLREFAVKDEKGRLSKEGVESWQKIKRTWIQGLIDQSAKGEPGSRTLFGESLSANFEKIGPKTLDEIFWPPGVKPGTAAGLNKSRAAQKEFRKVTELLADAGRARKSGFGTVVTRMIQFGLGSGAVAEATGEDQNLLLAAGLAGLAVSPEIWAKIITSEAGQRILTEGVNADKVLKGVKRSETAINVLRKLATLVKRFKEEDRVLPDATAKFVETGGGVL